MSTPAQVLGSQPRRVGHRGDLVGRFVGVGRDVGFPLGPDVADGVDVGTEAGAVAAVEGDVANGAGAIVAWPDGRWVDTTPPTDG